MGFDAAELVEAAIARLERAEARPLTTAAGSGEDGFRPRVARSSRSRAAGLIVLGTTRMPELSLVSITERMGPS
ncbi:hypothetical protein [Salinarimonas soli]|uniref:Uncharacterized protein n=1 Tax=Salinarimonas soli TaxID=1638099 RepID=A0A5B2VCS0_9HYPH|nr:hypothetical protein [Salinarimonas soli]KAA2236109.1 hypothetical protein F0L46_15440 [Salinarimonas soli]